MGICERQSPAGSGEVLRTTKTGNATGAKFRSTSTLKAPNSVWKMLEQCWEPQPDARPSIEDVLRCLEMDSPSPGLDVEMEESGGGLDSSNNSCKVFSFHPIRGVSWSLFLCATSETLRPEL